MSYLTNAARMVIETVAQNHVFGLDDSADFQILIGKCREFISNCDESLIKLAFNYCVIAHEGKLRKSGDKFYTHPLAVAFIVIQEIPLDDISVAAALLHNVLDESDVYTYEDIRFTFGTAVAQIVEGISRIKFVESQHIDRPDQMDNYRKLLLSLFTDIRIILIKLADKLHNMRTLQHVSPDSQKKIAQETLQIYAPFANRFGLRKIKFELEDLAFMYINPKEYRHIVDTIQGTHQEREEYIDKFKQPIVDLLDREGILKNQDITYEISGRAKHIYSIYNKTLLRNKKVEELYDIFAIRIILDTDNPLFCFYVYGIVANYYKPIPETFKDYISSPKANGYASLHTAVAGHNQRIVEVQIRTKDMHEASEVGVAAHFRYKSGVQSSIIDDANIQQWFDDVRNIFENIGNENSEKLFGLISNNMMQDTIYVFTPQDEFKELPKGATALDFAFTIHSEVGFHCIGAKINGKLLPINHILNSGDKVEIITSKKQKPTKDWLDFVVTSKASTKLLHYFKNLENEAIKLGKQFWQEKNDEIGFRFTNEELDSLLTYFNFKNIDDFYKSLGKNTVNLDNLHKFLMLKISDKILKEGGLDKPSIANTFINDRKNHEDFKNDIQNKQIVLATCCHPLPKESIFAINGKEDNIIVHSNSCKNYQKLLQTHSNEIVSIDWNDFASVIFTIELHIVGEDVDDLMHNIVVMLSKYKHLQIKNISFDTNNSIFDGFVVFEIDNSISVNDLIHNLEKIEGVQIVEKINKN